MKNNSRKIYVSIGVILSMMTLITVFAFRQEAQTNQQEQDDPPTPIQLGVMSEKQKRHSKLFEVPPGQGKRTLLDSLKKSPRGYIKLSPGDPNLAIPFEQMPFQTDFLRRNTCQADLVLIGTVTEKSSQVTTDLKTIFTDYGLTVNSLLFNKINLNLQTPTITVTRLGGSVVINNSKIDYIIKSQKRFKVGMTYLLFLSYLPDTNSFTTLNRESAFVATPNKIIRYNDTVPPYKNINDNSNFFINFVNESAKQCSTAGGN
jgi:hypothetical protein